MKPTAFITEPTVVEMKFEDEVLGGSVKVADVALLEPFLLLVKGNFLYAAYLPGQPTQFEAKYKIADNGDDNTITTYNILSQGENWNFANSRRRLVPIVSKESKTALDAQKPDWVPEGAKRVKMRLHIVEVTFHEIETKNVCKVRGF